LKPVSAYEKEYEDNWEPEVAKMPTPLSFPGLESRDVVIGMELEGRSRAYPLTALSPDTPIQDRIGTTPLLLVMGSDKKSVRAFISRLDESDIQFYRKSGDPNWVLVDSSGASEWNFQGCATSGPATGKCLEPLPALKDYWFDWRNYHPATTIYKH
jgi:hypothetical protein